MNTPTCIMAESFVMGSVTGYSEGLELYDWTPWERGLTYGTEADCTRAEMWLDIAAR